MSNTFSQMYVQIVFAVKNRQSLIHYQWEDELYKYITGAVQSEGQKMLAINGMPDHSHFLVGMKPNLCVSDLVREIKKSSNDMINRKRLSRFNFQWQEGFGAFTYGHLQLDHICNYIRNQKNHHQKTSFKEEYISLLNEFNLNFEEKYLFDWLP
jgi:putative transposase